MPSWKTGLEQKDAFSPSRIRQNEKMAKGCVVRALQSVTGEEATEAEWDRRFSDLKTGVTLLQLGDSVGWNTGALIPALERGLDGDIDDMLGLIAFAIDSGSPMGEALKTLEISRARLHPSGMQTAISEGADVVLAGLTSARGRIAMHAAHLGVNPDGCLMSRSDHKGVIKVDERDQYRVLLFKKKQFQ